jgi:hypothetical protein
LLLASCETGISPQGNISEESLGGKKKGRESAEADDRPFESKNWSKET